MIPWGVENALNSSASPSSIERKNNLLNRLFYISIKILNTRSYHEPGKYRLSFHNCWTVAKKKELLLRLARSICIFFPPPPPRRRVMSSRPQEADAQVQSTPKTNEIYRTARIIPSSENQWKEPRERAIWRRKT